MFKFFYMVLNKFTFRYAENLKIIKEVIANNWAKVEKLHDRIFGLFRIHKWYCDKLVGPGPN